MFARAEVGDGVKWLRTIAGFPEPGETVESTEKDKKIVVRYTPLGVAVGIVPWNFPVQLACGKRYVCLSKIPISDPLTLFHDTFAVQSMPCFLRPNC